MPHSAKKIEKRGPLYFLTFALLQNIEKSREDPLGTLTNFRKKCRKAEEVGSFIVPKKLEICFGMLVKKLTHTHQFEEEPSG